MLRFYAPVPCSASRSGFPLRVRAAASRSGDEGAVGRIAAVGAGLRGAEEAEQAGHPQLTVSETARTGHDQLHPADAGELESGHEGGDTHGVDETDPVHVEFDAL